MRQGGDYIVRTASNEGCPGVSPIVRVRIQDVRVGFSANSVAFGKLGSCESSREQIISLVNTGMVDVTIASTTFPPGFALRSPAPGFMIKAGQSQQVRITFAPPSSGTFNGQAVFTALPCSLAIPITLTGERVESAASLDRALVDFGTFSACPSSIVKVDSTFLIVNNGQGELVVQVPQVRPPFYLLTDFPAPKPVAPGSSLQIQIQYRPLGADLNQGVTQQIAFPFTSLTCSDTLRAQVQAASYQPKFTVDPEVTDLGVLLSCQSEIDTIVTVTNTSLVSVTIERIESADGVSLIGPSVTIPASSSKSIPVRIVAPVTPGPITRSAVVIGTPCDIRVPVTFEGLVIAPSYTPSTTSLSLGTIRPCDDSSMPSAQVVFVAKGLSGLRSRVNDVRVTGPFTTRLQSGSFFRDTLIVDVAAVSPLVVGVNSGTITLSIGPCNTEFVIPIRVTATERRWSAAVNQAVLGPLGNGQRTTTTLTVTNTGSDTITIAAIDGLIAPFQLLAPPTLPAILAPAESLQATVEYAFVGYERTDDQALRVVTSGLCADTFYVGVTGSTVSEGTVTGVMLVAPLDVVGTAGTTVQVPLALESMSALDSANFREMTVYLSYDASLVRPLTASVGSRGEVAFVREDRPGRAVVTVTHTQPIVSTQQLTTLAFQTYLAPVATTPLTIDSVIAKKVQITGRNGRIAVLGSCIISAELADLTNRVDARVIRNDNTSMELGISTITNDQTRITMYAMSGDHVATPLASMLPPGSYTLRFDVGHLASGTYIIVYEHGRHVRSLPIAITR